MKILVNDFAGHPFQIQLSRALAQAGHSVLHTYFAAIETPKGSISHRADDAGGFEIEPLRIGGEFKRYSMLSRKFADIAYGKAVSERMRSFRPDVVLSANMPLDAQKILLAASHKMGAKFIIWLQDLLSVGIEFVLRKKGLPFAGLVGAAYGRLERQLLSRSDAIVCIAPEFQSKLQEWAIPLSKSFLIENWAPLDELRPIPIENNHWAREHRIKGRFCYLYSGTLGMKHKPELLLRLAKHFETREDIVVVVVAQGAGADWLRSQAKKPTNLHVLPFQPYERLSEVLGAADVLVSILDNDCGAFAVPSKTLTYLCAGRALLVAAPESNLAARVVRRAGAGEIVSPEFPEFFLDAADRLCNDGRGRQRYATNARAYAERTFEIGKITQLFLQVFERTFGRAPQLSKATACSN